jgi:hypothetical membrane protein
MAVVNPTRLRWGACAWLLTLQFFVVETIAQQRFGSSYSRSADVISALGASTSAAHQLMNASFVIQAALIAAGAVLLRPALVGAAGRAVPVLLGAAAAGVLLVGVFPTDGNSTMHGIGAVAYLVGGGLGLIALAYAVRPRSEVVGTALALLGLVGTAATAFFLTDVTRYLGEGGTERVAAYVLPIGLALAGAALWVLGGENVPDRAARRAERDQERAEQAERDRQRDAALEAAAGRAAENTDAPDPDDPWAAPRRREN